MDNPTYEKLDWEGYVSDIQADEFSVTFIDEEEIRQIATFALNKLPPDQRNGFLQHGLIFRSVQMSDNVTAPVLFDWYLEKWTEDDIKRAEQKADELMKLLHINCDCEECACGGKVNDQDVQDSGYKRATG